LQKPPRQTDISDIVFFKIIYYVALDFFAGMWDNKYMTIDELTTHIFNMRNGLDEDLRNLADEMESLDPASKDFADLDFEYNFINVQVAAFNYVLTKIGLQ
jgi:hypothetical protein